MLRLETDYSSDISESTIKRFLNEIENKSPNIESILILNYGIGGLFDDTFIQKLLIKLRETYRNTPIIARPASTNYYIYEDVDLIKMNLQKALQTFSIDCCTETSVSIVGKKILNSAKCEAVFLSYLDSESYLLSKETEKLTSYMPIIQAPVRSYVSVGSIIMAILSLAYASNIPVSIGAQIALYGAAFSALLPPIEFFDVSQLMNYISSNLDES
jgi:bifunctional ADP-heptose synthase (sugar kinase/adenylyltransferase)